VTAISEHRTSEQGNAFDAAILRDFIRHALNHDAIADAVHDLLYDHVARRRYHPSVVTASLRPLIDEALNTATADDWTHVTRQLTAEAQEALGLDPAPAEA